MELFSTEIKYKKKFAEIIFYPAILLFASTPLFSDKGSAEILFGIIGSLLAVIFFLPWLNRLIGFKRIIIEKEFLIIESCLWIKYKTNKFKLEKINKLKFNTNEKAESYKSYGSVTILGYKHHPESMREYDRNPMTVHFDYERRKIKIGEGLKYFDGKKIVEIIKRQQKQTKHNKS